MKYRNFRPFGSISALTLGGGGIGNVWGKTTRKEAVDTVLYAIDSGINHLDMAPMYGRGEAELVVGEALKDRDVTKLNITTKCQLGTLPHDKVYEKLNESLIESFERMNIENIKKLVDFADLSSDELIGGFDEIKGKKVRIEGYLEEFSLSRKEADDLIMAAREIAYK